MMHRFFSWVDRTPIWLFVLLAVTLGLSPWVPEPHLVEKLRWLVQGELSRPLDIFDLFMHAVPWVLLALKLWRVYLQRHRAPRA